MILKQKRIALHFHIPITIKGDGYYYPEYYGSWVDSLAPYFKEVVCVTYSNNQSDENKYKIKSSNISLIDLGEKPILRTTLLKHKKYQNILLKNLDKFDMIFYRSPSPLVIYFYPLTRDKINIFFFIANMLSGFDNIKGKINPIKYYLWKTYWTFDHAYLQKYANASLTLSNGPTFLKEFVKVKNQKIIFTSTIYDKDVQDGKKQRDLNTPLRLLYLGRVSNEKSIDTLIEAINILNKKNIEIELNIAGSGDPLYENELKTLVKNLKIQNINFLGHVSKKENIENLMDRHDIFVIPSSWDWQPRTMWEATARGLPIICSKGVKSPYLLFEHEKDMLFVNIKDSVDLAENILKIRNDNALRNHLIDRSLIIAKERTIEQSVKLQINNILEYSNVHN